MSFRILMLFAILCVFWGIPYFFIKLALVDVSPACIAWGRITLGALVLLPVAWRRGALKSAARHWLALIAFAIIEMVIPFSLIALAETRLSSSLTGVLVATVPLTVVIVAPWFGVHEKVSARRFAGLLIGLLGVFVLLGFDSINGAAQWWSVGGTAVAVIGYAVGPLIVQRNLVGVDEIAAVALSLGVASLILLPVALLSWPTAQPATLSLVSIGVLGVISTAGAMLLYFYVIHSAGAARATIVAYISPAIAALLGIAVLHERLSMGIVIGLLLVLSGSALGSSGERAAQPVAS